ncbi:MAG: carboxypeptidase M32, partial [Pseudomonadota bacterium]
MSALEELFDFDGTTAALGQVMGRLNWDQETVMPPGAADQRAEEIAALETVLHARRQDARIGDWLERATPETASDGARLALLRRDFERAQRIPSDLAAELARLASRGQGLWVAARADEDLASFLPVLAEIVARKREAASALA